MCTTTGDGPIWEGYSMHADGVRTTIRCGVCTIVGCGMGTTLGCGVDTKAGMSVDRDCVSTRVGVGA